MLDHSHVNIITSDYTNSSWWAQVLQESLMIKSFPYCLAYGYRHLTADTLSTIIGSSIQQDIHTYEQMHKREHNTHKFTHTPIGTQSHTQTKKHPQTYTNKCRHRHDHTHKHTHNTQKHTDTHTRTAKNVHTHALSCYYYVNKYNTHALPDVKNSWMTKLSGLTNIVLKKIEHAYLSKAHSLI